MSYVILKNKAVRLRRLGHSYSYISEKILISKSTLHYWLATIPYTPNAETIERIGKARAKSGMVKSRLKRESIAKAKELAKDDIGALSKRDLFMLGIGLYIGEGTKTHSIIRVINADPKVIVLAIKWFKEGCGLNNTNFSIRLHLYPDNSEEDSLRFWSRATGLPKNQFQKIQVDLRKDKKMFKRGKLPYGTAHLTVKSNGKKEFGVFLSRRINAWIEEVVEYKQDFAGIV